MPNTFLADILHFMYFSIIKKCKVILHTCKITLHFEHLSPPLPVPYGRTAKHRAGKKATCRNGRRTVATAAVPTLHNTPICRV